MTVKADQSIPTPFDWALTPPNNQYVSLIDSVVMDTENFEFEVVKSRKEFRTDREREQFQSVVAAYVCNALSDENSRRWPGFEIDFHANPCPFNGETPANEAAKDTLALLCHPDLEFLKIIGETSGAEGEPYAFTIAVANRLLELLGRIAGSTAYAPTSLMESVSLSVDPDEASPVEATPETRSSQGVAYPKVGTSSGDLSETAVDRAPNPLDHSRPLDVHVSSEHPEVKAFVNDIYDRYFKDGVGNTEIRKKHVKVILLDLYVAWANDPDLKIAFSRNVNAYKAKSRYNELHISKLTPAVIDRLVEVGLVEQAKGFKDRESGIGRVSRMWPTPRLIRMFEDARFGPADMEGSWDRETIILRDDKKKDIDYEDTDETRRMREIVNGYNALIRHTFIDIPVLEKRYIELEQTSGGKPIRLEISQRNKVTRRIFNRSHFDKGGRFFGGWWQQCPKEWRGKIFIDDKPTSELDYSGLHVVMLYAQEGIDYWAEVKTDPYIIDCPEFEGSSDELRAICKQLLLVSLNAASDLKTYQAFRHEAPDGSSQKRMSNGILRAVFSGHGPELLSADVGPGQEIVDLTVRVAVDDPGENIRQVTERLDVVQLARLD